MKGKLSKQGDSWFVLYDKPETIGFTLKWYPLHPDDYKQLTGYLKTEKYEVEFEIEILTKSTTYDQPDRIVGKVAKLVVEKQEKNSWDEIFSEYYRRNWGMGKEFDKSILEDWLKKYYNPPIEKNKSKQ